MTESNDVPAAAPVARPAGPLDEFCATLSREKWGPEPIAGFAYSETAAGRMHATDVDYRARFDAWLKQPV